VDSLITNKVTEISPDTPDKPIFYAIHAPPTAESRFKKVTEITDKLETKPTSSLTSLSLLLVDDDIVSQAIVAGLLTIEGYKVVVVSSGEEALKQVLLQTFDVVLMDLRMPGMDGFETTKHMVKIFKKNMVSTVIVAFTGDVMKETVQNCLNSGMGAVIPKPIDISAMNRVITSLTGKTPPNS
jgi:CheY-like chemotaxis protein